MQKIKLINKMKFYSKKTFAVMLALVMMMSCWVFTPMIEAEAITQGTYYFMLVFFMDESFYVNGDSYIYVKDASGNTLYSEQIDGYFEAADDTYAYYYFSSTTFPASTNLTGTKQNMSDQATWAYSLYVDSSAYSSSNRGSISSSSSSVTTTKGTRLAYFDYSNYWSYNDSMAKSYTITNQPTPTTMYSSATSASVTVPTSGTTTVDSPYFYMQDQFGVTLSTLPTVTMSTSTGVSMALTNQTYGYDSTIYVTSSALMSGSTSSKSVTVTGSYSNVTSKVYTLTLNDPTYTYTFNGNGGTHSSGSTSITEDWGDDVAALPVYTLSNYRLVGFSTDELDYIYNITDTYSISNQITTSSIITSSDTIYAVWLADNHTVTINYDTNGDGTIDSTVTQDVPYSKTLDYVDFTIADTDVDPDSTYHYTFAGWQINETTSKITDDETLMATEITDNISYTATYTKEAHTWQDDSYAESEGTAGYNHKYCTVCGYEEVPEETITGYWTTTFDYEINTGTDTSIQTTMGEKIDASSIADPVKAADTTYTYEFAYWYDVENSTKTEIDLANFTPTKTTTLAPYFEATYIDYTITVVDGDENEIKITGHADDYILDLIEENNIVATQTSTDPAIEYIFDYWTFDDGGATVGATALVGTYVDSSLATDEVNIVLNANFDEEKVTNIVTVVDEDGDFITSYEVEYGETLKDTGWSTKDQTKAADETNTYTFSHWEDVSGNKITPSETAIKDTLTISPVFDETPIDYTITWQNDDGTTYDDEDANIKTSFGYGDELTFPTPPPTKTNASSYETWTFTGWKNVLTGDIITYDSETGAYNSTTTTVDGNATYIATFVNATQSKEVTVLDKDGKTIATITVANGDTLENIAVFNDYDGDIYYDADNHYTFSAWKFTTDGYTTSDISTTPITENVTIQAVYTKASHNYDTNKDGTVDVDDYGIPVINATCTQEAIYEVKCTYCDYVHQVTGSTTDHTYEWSDRVEPSGTTAGSETEVCTICGTERNTRDLYLVTFSNEGETVESFVVTEGVDDTITSDELPIAYKLTGDDNIVYTFDYWQVNNVEVDFDVAGGYVITENTTFHAKFTSVQHYVVSYMAQNNLYVSGLYPTGETLALLADEFDPQDYQDDYNTYTFSYWSLEDPEDEKIETPEEVDPSTVTITADTTLYAVYEVSQKAITVTYDAGTNGGLIGTDETVEQSQYSGTSVDTSITATKASDDDYAYDFSHWSTTENGAAFSGTITTNTTLYAVYSQVKLYTVTFYDEAGTTPLYSKIIRADAVFTDEIVNSVGVPTKDPDNSSYYAFSKWVDENGADVTTGSVLSADLKLYATFDATTTRYYTISFIDFYGETIQTDKFEYEDSFPSVPSVEELIDFDGQLCYFLGWYDASDDNKSLVTFPDEVTADTTYKAYYQHDVTTYSVTYKDETGETTLQILDEVVGQTSAVYTGAIPTKATDEQGSYTFIGWALSTDATDTVTSELDFVTKDLTVYAKFQLTGHMYTTSVTYEATCTTDGGTYYICEDCGYAWCKEITDEATGHNFVLLETEMDSEYNFKEIWRCTGCGEYKYEAYNKEAAVKVIVDVQDTTGNAINLAKVVVYNGNNLEMYKTYTNSDGQAVVYLMYDGEYTVNITGSNMADTLGTIEITTTEEDGTTTRDYTVGIDDIDPDDCSCTCHGDGLWSTIFRFFHNIFKSFTSGKISCCGCPDERYYS